MKKAALMSAAALLAFASQAHAFSYFTVGATTGQSSGDPGLALGETSVVTFDSANAPGVIETFSGTRQLTTGTSGSAAAPFGDTSTYEALGTGGSATFDFSGYTASHTVNTVSVYLGSIDAYNTIEVLGAHGAVIDTITGSMLPAYNGDQGAAITNRRLYIGLSPSDGFTGLRFSSSGVAFEYDSLGATAARYAPPTSTPVVMPTAVPEPSTWAMMVLGLGGLGLVMRRKKAATAAAFG